MKPLLLKDLGMRYPTAKSKQKKRYGLYQCDFCENTFEATVNNISKKERKSFHCGCRRDNHRMSKSKLYLVYKSMVNRCHNSNVKSYKNYGGRGIVVCKEWREKASNFINWALENGYKEGLTIDRVNNDGNYEPINCRWVTPREQEFNKRVLISNNTIGFRGVYKDHNRYRVILVVNWKRINVGTYATKEEAAYYRDKYIIDNKLPNIRNFNDIEFKSLALKYVKI